jgi:hypothetical protein
VILSKVNYIIVVVKVAGRFSALFQVVVVRADNTG